MTAPLEIARPSDPCTGCAGLGCAACSHSGRSQPPTDAARRARDVITKALAEAGIAHGAYVDGIFVTVEVYE